MRNFFILIITSILLYACSGGSQEAQLGTLNQEPCRNEMEVSDQNVFTGETVDNLNVFQQGSSLYATMDVRTICNTNVAFDLETNENNIRLILRNVSNRTADCVCTSKITTSVANIEKGDYKVTVVNPNNQLLAQGQVTIR